MMGPVETGGVVVVAIGLIELLKMTIGKLTNGRAQEKIEDAIRQIDHQMILVTERLRAIAECQAAITKAIEAHEQKAHQWMAKGCPNKDDVLEVLHAKNEGASAISLRCQAAQDRATKVIQQNSLALGKITEVLSRWDRNGS